MCHMAFQPLLVSILEIFEVSALLRLDLMGWRLYICPSLSQLLCTLQLLSNCCTLNSIINVIATYTKAEMCFFVSIHSTKDTQCAKNLNTHVTLFTHMIYSSVDFHFLLLLNRKKIATVFN